MSYDAALIIETLAVARSHARRTHTPQHIVRRGDRDLEIVSTVTPSDKVLITGIMAPRRTTGWIEKGCLAEEEIGKALPHIMRAAELIGHDSYAEEIAADLLEGAFDAIREARRAENKPARRAPLFARLFGRAAY